MGRKHPQGAVMRQADTWTVEALTATTIVITTATMVGASCPRRRPLLLRRCPRRRLGLIGRDVRVVIRLPLAKFWQAALFINTALRQVVDGGGALCYHVDSFRTWCPEELWDSGA